MTDRQISLHRGARMRGEWRIALGWQVVLILCVSHPVLVSAQQVEHADGPPVTSLQEAQSLQDRAQELKQRALQQFESNKYECYQKLLPNSCIETATERKNKSLAEAHQLAKKAREAKKNFHAHESELKEAKRLADAPQREADEKARIGKFQSELAAQATKRTAKAQAEADEASRGRARFEAQEASRRNKHEAQAQRAAAAERRRPVPEDATRKKRIDDAAEHAANVMEKAKKKEEDIRRRDANEAAKRATEEANRKKEAADKGFLCWIWPSRFCDEQNSAK